jgi:hypothetical protein
VRSPDQEAGGGRASKKAKRAAARQSPDKRPKQDTPATPAKNRGAFASVELGFAGGKLTDPDGCRKSLLDAGFDNAGAARMAWGKDLSNRGLCFWHNSPYGKAGGGCPFTDCKFAPPGHNG